MGQEDVLSPLHRHQLAIAAAQGASAGDVASPSQEPQLHAKQQSWGTDSISSEASMVQGMQQGKQDIRVSRPGDTAGAVFSAAGWGSPAAVAPQAAFSHVDEPEPDGCGSQLRRPIYMFSASTGQCPSLYWLGDYR